MKNKLLLIIYLHSISLIGQSNLNFENWSNKGSYYDLDSWYTGNTFYKLGANTSCHRGMPHSGSFSLGVSPIFLFMDTTPGYAFQQFEYTQRAKSISLYYKYSSKTFDSSGLELDFFKGNSSDTNNKIGSAQLYFILNNNWSYMSQEIKWKNNEAPDSALIFIFNSFENKSDTLFIDDISISKSTNNTNQSLFQNFNIFINSNSQLILENLEINKTYGIKVRDNIGQTVLDLSTCEKKIDLSELEIGLYTFEVFDSYRRISSGKIIKYQR